MDTLNTTEQLDAVDRVVATGARDGQETKSVVLTQTYPVPLADLWHACTDAERISRWLMPITGDLHLGGHYQLEGNAGGTVQDCDPARRLAVTWEFGGEVSWVVATFTGDAESATLQVEHTAPVDQGRWEQFGPGAVGIGWDSMFLGLALHLGSGESLDPAEAMAWSASDEGKAFMARSGAAWRDAQIAAGEDATGARESAERCLAAYTG